MLETHQYADADSSGTNNSCVDTARMKTVMANITQWAISTKQRLFLGEFGVAPNEACLKALSALVDGTKNTSTWGGWTYWSTGRWLGSYPFSIQPDENGEKPQVEILKRAM